MDEIGRGIGKILGAFLGGFITVIIYIGCIGWGFWRVLKLLGQAEKQGADFVLPVLLILLGIAGFIWTP